LQSFTIHTHVGKDGILKLETPIDIRNADVEVVLVVNQTGETPPLKQSKAWPPGFFERFAGSLPDLPPRGPQGEYEVRDGLE
jgi:hypothetical protein